MKMNAIAIILFCTGISLIISAFVIRHISKQVLKLFETQDKYNEMIVKYLNKIFDIINLNDLKKPKEEESEV